MWEICPIHTATQHCLVKGMLDRGSDADREERMDIPFVCWLLRNIEDNTMFLVDCGPDFDNETNAALHQPMTMHREWHILRRLQELEISVKYIKAIIATHLHWDHLKAIIDLPSEIPVFAQKSEFEWAVSSKGKSYGKPYESDIGETPFFLKCIAQYRFVDGDAEIAPGINVIPVPGHTAGSQAVMIDSVKGKIILANDIVNVLENWNPGIPPGNIIDKQSYYESISRLRHLENEGWIIIPGHDFRIFSDLKTYFNDKISIYD